MAANRLLLIACICFGAYVYAHTDVWAFLSAAAWALAFSTYGYIVGREPSENH